MKESTTSGCLNTRNSTLPFFMWGFAHGILEVLNPHFQESFHISKTMSALTQAAVYGAYFLMALPAGKIIQKWGYRRGVITGLVLFGIGSLMFIPGSEINSFYFFVLSLFVIGCGLTCLETSANPYTTVLGHPDKAESRINLSQSLNGIGWIVGPLVGGQLLFSGVNIAIPYALVGIFVLSVALVLSRISLPDPRRAHEADTNEKAEFLLLIFWKEWRRKNLVYVRNIFTEYLQEKNDKAK